MPERLATSAIVGAHPFSCINAVALDINNSKVAGLIPAGAVGVSGVGAVVMVFIRVNHDQKVGSRAFAFG